jgi:hypothetical protein
VDYSKEILEPIKNLHSQMKALDISHEILTPGNIQERAKKEPRSLYVVFGSLYMIGQFLQD